jgi:quinol monooxygenase YgiN
VFEGFTQVGVSLAETVRGMIQARLTIFAHPTQRDELVRSIMLLVEASRLDSGCLDCRLYADVADPNALTLVEEWTTRNDMERRMRSNSFGQLLQLMEASSEPPESVFHTITETSGLEAIRKARFPSGRTVVQRQGRE